MDKMSPHELEWTDAYSVGFDRMDVEHKEIMTLANRVIRAIDLKRSEQEIHDELDILLGRTCRHFFDEESTMAQTGFLGLSEHRTEHNHLARMLIRFSVDYRSGEVSAAQAADFLKDWLVDHVIKADLDYLPHF